MLSVAQLTSGSESHLTLPRADRGRHTLSGRFPFSPRPSQLLAASQCERAKLHCLLLTHTHVNRISNCIIGRAPRSLRLHYLTARSILTSQQTPACGLVPPVKATHKHEHYNSPITSHYSVQSTSGVSEVRHASRQFCLSPHVRLQPSVQ
jgi:hypothetical protein